MPTAAAAVLDDISQLIAIPSVSSFDTQIDMSNRPVIDYLADRFSGLGFAADIRPLPDNAAKSNLVATLGRGDGGLVLSGHTDTVPFDEGLWDSDPFQLRQDGEKLYGLGSADMKSFFALVLAACADLDPLNLKAPLIVLATADEETSMAGAKALAAGGGLGARYGIIGEPTNLRPIRLHKGILMERIRIEGRGGHSANPELGNSALEGMHRVMAELMAWRNELRSATRNDAFEVPYVTLNLARIAGGDSPNRICGACELDLDLRMLPGMTTGQMRTELRKRVQRALDGTGLVEHFEILFDGIEPLETRIDSELITATESLTGVPSSGVAFGTEGPLLSKTGMDIVVLGPGSIDQAHQPNEFLRLDGIDPTITILRGLIRQFCC